MFFKMEPTCRLWRSRFLLRSLPPPAARVRVVYRAKCASCARTARGAPSACPRRSRTTLRSTFWRSSNVALMFDFQTARLRSIQIQTCFKYCSDVRLIFNSTLHPMAYFKYCSDVRLWNIQISNNVAMVFDLQMLLMMVISKI